SQISLSPSYAPTAACSSVRVRPQPACWTTKARSTTRSSACSATLTLPPEHLEIAVAIVRFGDELLMVRQAGPGGGPFWTIPGGRLEPGEFAFEALVREVKEETGVTVLDPGPIAFTAQVDERREGWFATVWTFDVDAWEGEIAVADPDGFVQEAAWVPIA